MTSCSTISSGICSRARRLLTTAAAHGWQVEVVYVHRPFEDVVRAVIERSQRTGRWNRLADLPSAHVDAQRTILRLSRDFKDRVWLHCVYNASARSGDREPGSIVSIRELASGGRYHLVDAQSLLQVIPPILRKAQSEDIVSPQVARLVGQGLPK